MRKLLVILLVTLPFLGACEDSKKGNSNKATKAIETADTTSAKAPEVPEPKIETSSQENEKDYPELTNDNVVEFLTEYGEEHPETRVRISTNHGDIEMSLFRDTPLHRANFIYLVKEGYFNSTFFHRVVPNFIIQGGNSDNIKTARHRARIGKYLIPAEIVPGRIHQYGTVSGAKEYRRNPGKQTAPFEFFIFLGPKSATGHLNGNYTIFGRVTSGMDVVEKISELTSDDGEWPLRNVYISAEVID